MGGTGLHVQIVPGSKPIHLLPQGSREYHPVQLRSRPRVGQSPLARKLRLSFGTIWLRRWGKVTRNRLEDDLQVSLFFPTVR